MAYHFYKHKLLLDENMPPRCEFPRLNGLFDVKHVRDDLKSAVSTSLPSHQIDTKLTALLVRSSAKALLGKLTIITGET